jgi:hypothetical protein
MVQGRKRTVRPDGTMWCPRCETWVHISKFNTMRDDVYWIDTVNCTIYGRPDAYCKPCTTEYHRTHRIRKRKQARAVIEEYYRVNSVPVGRPGHPGRPEVTDEELAVLNAPPPDPGTE